MSATPEVRILYARYDGGERVVEVREDELKALRAAYEREQLKSKLLEENGLQLAARLEAAETAYKLVELELEAAIDSRNDWRKLANERSAALIAAEAALAQANAALRASLFQMKDCEWWTRAHAEPLRRARELT